MPSHSFVLITSYCKLQHSITERDHDNGGVTPNENENKININRAKGITEKRKENEIKEKRIANECSVYLKWNDQTNQMMIKK